MAAKKKTADYVVSITVGDKTYKGSGATPLEALRTMPRPQKITAKAFLEVKAGDKHKIIPLSIERAKRFFYPQAQVFLAKSLLIGLK